jgi:mannose-1-phosphate guanylyltransferase/mannose-6-phosphate isomerase
VRPIILSGGGGTRLWPLSRAGVPKQFVSIVEDDSLLQSTARRCSGEPFLPPIIVAGEQQRFFVLDQLKATGADVAAVILEPAPRSTAPAIGLAALWALQSSDDLVLVMPSDHVIKDIELWRSAVVAAMPAALTGSIVAFGVKPSWPNTGYGYIRARPVNGEDAVRNIERFIEKPDQATVTTLLNDPNCYWNTGMLLMRPSAFIHELWRFAPEIASATEKSMRRSVSENPFIRPDKSAFLETPSESIDYAVMELTDRARVMPVDFGWSDVGSWDAVRDVLEQDADGNVIRGDVLALDVRNSLLRCETDMTLAAVGLSDIVCVITDDAAFISPLSRAQDNKKVVQIMRAKANPRADRSAWVHREWGMYHTIDRGDRSETRRVAIKPGTSRSAQAHPHRSRHFVIISGKAEFTVTGRSERLNENRCILVPAGAAYRIRNIGDGELHFIEVQCW